MQMIPPPAKPTLQHLQAQTGKDSRRRLIFLGVTATVASVIGVALGSTVRFHVAAAGDSAALFKPQQDFPPLAEWPPSLPMGPEDDRNFDTWNVEATDVPQLVYNDTPEDDADAFDRDTDVSLQDSDTQQRPRRLTSIGDDAILGSDVDESWDVVQDDTEAAYQDENDPVYTELEPGRESYEDEEFSGDLTSDPQISSDAAERWYPQGDSFPEAADDESNAIPEEELMPFIDD